MMAIDSGLRPIRVTTPYLTFVDTLMIVSSLVVDRERRADLKALSHLQPGIAWPDRPNIRNRSVSNANDGLILFGL